MLEEETYARERVSEEIIKEVLGKRPSLFVPVFWYRRQIWGCGIWLVSVKY